MNEIETGWVIEPAPSNGLALSLECAKRKWYVFDKAIRFARKQDALDYIRVHMTDRIHKVVAVEHQWGE